MCTYGDDPEQKTTPAVLQPGRPFEDARKRCRELSDALDASRLANAE